jgi:uncharacterized membrane protein
MNKIKQFFSKPKSISTCVLIFGVCLIIAGFCVPPVGVIDGSVLTGLGEIFAFSASIDGLSYLKEKLPAQQLQPKQEEEKE